MLSQKFKAFHLLVCLLLSKKSLRVNVNVGNYEKFVISSLVTASKAESLN